MRSRLVNPRAVRTAPITASVPELAKRILRAPESHVANTIEHGGALLCEAGTGVGKSLAYLIPAAAAGRTVVISTATRALQSQLLHDDLGTFVYDEVEGSCGRPVLALEVNIDPPNEPSLAFHRARGFTEVGQSDASGHLVSLMVKQLS